MTITSGDDYVYPLVEDRSEAFLRDIHQLFQKIVEVEQEYLKYNDPHHYYSMQALSSDTGLMLTKPEGVAGRLAELFCDLQDLCAKYNIPLEKAIEDISAIRARGFK